MFLHVCVCVGMVLNGRMRNWLNWKRDRTSCLISVHSWSRGTCTCMYTAVCEREEDGGGREGEEEGGQRGRERERVGRKEMGEREGGRERGYVSCTPLAFDRSLKGYHLVWSTWCALCYLVMTNIALCLHTQSWEAEKSKRRMVREYKCYLCGVCVDAAYQP